MTKNLNPLYEFNISKGPIGSKYRNFVAAAAKGAASPKVRKATAAYTLATVPFPFTATIPVGAFTILPPSAKKRLVIGILKGEPKYFKSAAKALGVKVSDIIKTLKEKGASKEVLKTILL